MTLDSIPKYSFFYNANLLYGIYDNFYILSHNFKEINKRLWIECGKWEWVGQGRILGGMETIVIAQLKLLKNKFLKKDYGSK